MTVAELLKRASEGIHQTRAIGTATATEIRDSLYDLRASVGSGGVDWDCYAKRRHITVLPNRKTINLRPPQVLEALTRVGEIASRIQYDELGAIIFQQRFAQPLASRATYAAIGRRFAKSPQFIRKTAESMMLMFRQAIWFGDYSGCRFRFHTDFLNQLRYFGESRMIATLVPPDLAVILTMPKSPVFVSSESRWGLIAKRVRVRKIAPPKSLRMISTVGYGATASVKQPQRAAMLPKTYRYEEILRKAGRPLHYKEIFALSEHVVRPGGKLRATLVASRLSADPRFVPLGGSGFWALAEWPNIELRPVPDIVAAVLGATTASMTVEEVFRVVLAQRPVSRRTIEVTLSRDMRFKRGSQGGWTLRRRGR
jgi:hypothetical protein